MATETTTMAVGMKVEASSEPFNGNMDAIDMVHIPIELPRLTEACNKGEVSFSRVLQLAWGAVLRTYTGSNDVGFLAISPLSAGRVEDWYREVCHLDMAQAQDIPVIDLLRGDARGWNQEHLGSESETTGCDTVILWKVGRAEMLKLLHNYHTSDLRALLTVEESTDDYTHTANMHYSTSKISNMQAKRMAAAATLAVTTIVNRPLATLGELELCGEEDLRLLQKWNNAEQVWLDECVHHRISRWSMETPDRLAVSAWDGDLSYGELDRQSSQLAVHLMDLGVEPDQFVPVCSEKSKWLIVSILGVIKAGCAYVVLEPAYTLDRMQGICDELQTSVIVASEKLAHTASKLSDNIVTLGGAYGPLQKTMCKSQHERPTSPLVRPHHALYVVFSSGSTGKPKGIIVEHGGFVSWGMATADSIYLNRDCRVLQFASFAFLVAHRDVLLTLMHGACICVPSETDRLNGLETFMTNHKVNWANLTPSVAALLDPAKTIDLKTLVFTGEPMSLASLTVWEGKVKNLIYAYGQAESVSISCVRKNPTLDEDRLNLGHRVGKAIWLVDPLDHNKLVPVGAVGELVVEGRAIARGYIDAERTVLAFMREMAWLSKVRPPGYSTRLYKTGDLAQYNEDGSLRFVCRKDNAVKLHGQRVELDEVEHHVRGCMAAISNTGVHDVVVDVATLNNNLMLAVFLGLSHTSPESRGDILIEPLEKAPVYLHDIVSRLEQDNLPQNQIPTLLVPLSRIPLNPSGKTDRKRLRQIVAAMTPEETSWCIGQGLSEDGVESAKTQEERSLQQLWAQILNIAASSIGRHDNFFRRGGNSLTAMKLASLTQETESMLSFSDVFLHPTLSAQAQLVGDKSTHQASYSVEPFALLEEGQRQELLKLCQDEYSLSPSSIEDIYPTTPMQAGLIALTTLSPGTYVSQRVFEVDKDVRPSALEETWKSVSDANTSLRTRIIQHPDGGTFQVVVCRQFEFKIVNSDLETYLQEDKSKPMQMGQSLARLAIVRGNENQLDMCVLTVHHCAYDAWTIPLLLEQLNAAYAGKSLPPQPFSPFVNYVHKSYEKAKNHWAAEFAGLEAEAFPPLPSPTYKPIVTGSEKLNIKIPPPSEGNNTNGITLSNRIGLAWGLAIARYTASREVVYGLTVSGRGAPVTGIDKMAAPTIATIPLRIKLRSTSSIQDELQTLQDKLVGMVPFEQYGLQNISKLGQEAERACQFQSLLVVQQESRQHDEQDSIIRSVQARNGGLTLDTYALTLICTPANDGGSIQLEAQYDGTILSKTQLRKLMGLFVHILSQVNSVPGKLIGDVDAISPADLKQLRAWNGHIPPPPENPVSIVELIKKHCMMQPEASAVDAWDGSLTYKELDERSSALSVVLAEHGARRETFIPICLDKSKWVSVAIMSVVKAGAAFILLDPSHPIQRLRGIREDSHAEVVISSEAHVQTANKLGSRHVVQVDYDYQQPDRKQGRTPQPVNGNDAFCAVFTSGSTGKPKGVILEHAGFATNAILMGPDFRLSKASRVFQFASHSFDAAVADYIYTLIWGGCVCVPSAAASRDDLATAMNNLRINWSVLTPSVARCLDPEDIPKLNTLVIGGELAKEADIDRLSARHGLMNAYGPSECTIYGTLKTNVVKGSSPRDIGRPIAARCWIVDPNNPNQLSPIGAVGELLFEGPIVARGYMGQTNGSSTSPFIKPPKWLETARSEESWEGTTRVYKTGDLARYNPTDDGSLEIMGRKDQQVKLRGQRIELGEIEYQIAQCISTRADVVAEVIAQSHNQTPMLVAFIKAEHVSSVVNDISSLFPAPNAQFQAMIAQLEPTLQNVLPRHMVPALFIPLAYIPLSPNGKTNRRLLKEKAALLARQELDAYRPTDNSTKRRPSTKVERTIQKLMSDVLHLDPSEIGMDDHFFHLGGDSISAMSIATQARKAGLRLGMADILSNPRLSALVVVATDQLLSADAEGEPEDRPDRDAGVPPFSLVSSMANYDDILNAAMKQCRLTKDQIEDIYPCTPMQEGLFALTMHQPDAYVWRFALELSDDVDVARFQAAWDSVYQANPILRTRIVSVGSEGHFQVVDSNPLVWNSTDGLSIRPGSPLFNIQLVHPQTTQGTLQQKPRVVLALHHAIYDDVSIKSTLAQLDAAYNGSTLKPTLYSPFVNYCHSLTTTQGEKVTEFWNGELGNMDTSTPFPAIPADGYTIQASKSLEHTFPFRLNPRIGHPLTSVVQLAWGLAVSQFTGDRNVVFGAVSSGRAAMIKDIEHICGPTIATYPFRVHHEPHWTVQQALDEVQSRRARMVPYEQTGLQHIRQVVGSDACSFQNLLLVQFPGDQAVPSSPLYRRVMDDTIAAHGDGGFDTYPLTVTVIPVNGSIVIKAMFDESLAPTPLVQRVLAQFAHILSTVNEMWMRPISELPSISASDMAQLQMWNATPSFASVEEDVEEDLYVHDLIQKSVVGSPKSQAVCAWDGQLSYKELDHFSSLLAGELLQFLDSTLQRRPIVPLFFEPSKWTPVALLAAMKAGMVFMLLDPGHPDQRLQEICRLVTPVVILSSKSLATRASSLAAETNIMTVDGDNTKWAKRASFGSVLKSQQKRGVKSPEDALYIVFTSGSTGEPKGIIISHRSYCSMSKPYCQMVGIGPETRGFGFSSYAFDVSIADMLNPLISGGCVCVPSAIDRTANLPDAVARLGANFIDITPSMLRTIRPEDIPSVKTVVIGGEPLTREIVQAWADKVRLVQAYGPAECCPNSTVRNDLTVTSDPSNIGVGAGCRRWIVDPHDHGRLMPIGAVGELLIEGPIVGSGYLKNTNKTAASFIQPPRWAIEVLEGVPIQKQRFYKTGDLVRYDENGSLLFIGRKDTQVKIRGQRVEIAEIEHHLSQLFPHASGTAVELFQLESGTPQELVAFIFCGDEIWRTSKSKDEASLFNLLGISSTISTVSDIKAQLEKALPRYMVPTRYQLWASMPTSLSAKLNRKKLQAHLRTPNDATSAWIELHEPNSTNARIDIENPIALALNKKMLSLVGQDATNLMDQDFRLSTLGLDSIQMIMLVTFIRNEFDVKVAVGTLYDPGLTVTGLAAMISCNRQSEISLPDINLSTEIQHVYQKFTQRCASLHRRKRVFLTGATGLLGTQTLHQLLDDASVDKVIVHVRASTAEEALERVISTATTAQWWSSSYLDRIECVPGDLSAPRLGLQPSKWRMLCNRGTAPKETITDIIHNGAAVHWQAPYQTLKPVNVDSVINLLTALDQWDHPGNFTLISGGLQRSPDQDIESFAETVQRSNGYSQTKFVAEELVSMYAARQTAANHHISIVRPGLVIGTVNEGVPNIDDFQWRLVQICLRMGTYPMHQDAPPRWMAVADAEEVAAEIITATFEESQEDKSKPSTVDIETGITVSEFWELVQGTVGVELEAMEPEKWKQDAARFLDWDDPFRPLLAFLQQSGGGFGVQRPEIANSLRPGVVRKNVQTLVDVGFLSTGTNTGGVNKVGNMAVFNRSRR